MPGKIAYVLQEGGAADALFKVDLATGVATAITLTIPTGAYNTGRSVEEAQLTSWKDATSATKRRFHMHFNNVVAGDG